MSHAVGCQEAWAAKDYAPEEPLSTVAGFLLWIQLPRKSSRNPSPHILQPVRSTLLLLRSSHTGWCLQFPVAVGGPSVSEKHEGTFTHSRQVISDTSANCLMLLSSYLAVRRQERDEELKTYTGSDHND